MQSRAVTGSDGKNASVIVDCAIYRDGRREDVSHDLAAAFQRTRAVPDSFIWIGLHEPSIEEFDRVSQEFSLHPLAVEDAVHAHQRPKLERYGHSLFLVLKTLRYVEETSSIEAGEIMLFVGEGFVVTVQHGETNPLGSVRRRLEGEERILRRGPAAVLYAVCDEVVDTYGLAAAGIEQDVEEVEQSVFSPTRTNDAERIYSLKREVMEFRRAVIPLATPMRALTEGAVPGVDEETRPFFRDVTDHVLRVSEQVQYFDDLLASVLTPTSPR